jgi:Tol biopolymer transport system component
MPALLALVVGVAPSAHAAIFPGIDGLLVFEREMPAGDHTQSDLFTMRADGSHLSRLTSTANQNEFGAAWNPAGTRLAFWRTRAPFGTGSIWTADADGSHATRLTSGFDARDPSWGPSGESIVFTRVDGSDFNLWTMRASDGGDQRQLTTGAELDFEPAWSPNGKRIAFTRGSETGDPGDIYMLNLASGRSHRITDAPAYDHQVSWAPCGRKLLFERDFDASSAIEKVGLDGSHVDRLTTGPHFDTGPVASPDGRRIAFGSDRGGAALDDLWVMTADGSDAHDVRKLRYSEGLPDWQRASSRTC